MSPRQKSLDLLGSTITFETGKYCSQANACVTVQVGDTKVMAVVAAGSPREGADFLPLSVDYEERLYAAGIIKSSRYVKREGRPPDENILIARLIDRSIRPLFPKTYRNEVQVITTVMSYDGEHDPEWAAAQGAFAALSISNIPWAGPLGMIRMKVNSDGRLTATLAANDSAESPTLIVAGNGKLITMIEGMLPELSDAAMSEGLESANTMLRSISSVMNDLRSDWGIEKQTEGESTLAQTPDSQIESAVLSALERFVEGSTSGEFTRHEFTDEVKTPILEEIADEWERLAVEEFIDQQYKSAVRRLVLDENKRIDGRQIDEIRPLSMAIDEVPRAHGSAMFKRGETQALNVATLGSLALQQLRESIRGEERKRYIHHYIAPPYSVGETGRIGSPGRREIGHGALAEKALVPVLPSEDEFPYTIRLVSEVLSQNGSSSMASVCASTLSLMAAGVPIRRPVAGIALGLMSDEAANHFRVLTDIAGIEDFGGDMDFKVAGTSVGITAIQMDTKLPGISIDIAREAITQAAKARNTILNQMLATIGAPRAEVSQYAPKMLKLTIPVDAIGKVIGSGGKVINRLSKEHDAKIDINDDGVVTVSAIDQSSIDRLKRIIDGITTSPKPGEVITGLSQLVYPYRRNNRRLQRLLWPAM